MDQDLKSLFESAIAETGIDLQQSAHDVALYTSQRMAHLALIVGLPGYEEALVAERDNVALFAGISAVNSADAADQRIIGIIQGALAIGAKAIAPPPA